MARTRGPSVTSQSREEMRMRTRAKIPERGEPFGGPSGPDKTPARYYGVNPFADDTASESSDTEEEEEEKDPEPTAFTIEKLDSEAFCDTLAKEGEVDLAIELHNPLPLDDLDAPGCICNTELGARYQVSCVVKGYFFVSSRRLREASPVIDRMLAPNTRLGMDLLAGQVPAMVVHDETKEPLMALLALIHGTGISAGTLRTLGRTLRQVGTLWNEYQITLYDEPGQMLRECKAERYDYVPSLCMTTDPLLMLPWLYRAWLFKKADRFRHISQNIICELKGKLADTPMPPKDLTLQINKRRQEALAVIANIIGILYGMKPVTACQKEATRLMFEDFKSLRAMRDGSPPYDGVSLNSLRSEIGKARANVICYCDPYCKRYICDGIVIVEAHLRQLRGLFSWTFSLNLVDFEDSYA